MDAKKILNYLIPALAIGCIGYYFWYNCQCKKSAEAIPETPPEPQLASAPIELNHLTDRIEVKKSDGDVMKGYPFPQDISKVKFPVFVITLPNNRLGIEEANSFQVHRSQSGKPFVIKAQMGDKYITERELIDNTIIL